jgi:hypothetical protein
MRPSIVKKLKRAALNMRCLHLDRSEMVGAKPPISGDNTNRIDSHRHEVAMNS